jgi:alpha-D-glucose phosphate-specific phosphoglucomutase
MPFMTLFVDTGGVLLTNGWKHQSRESAAKRRLALNNMSRNPIPCCSDCRKSGSPSNRQGEPTEDAATDFERRAMKVSPLAGKPAETSMLVNVPRLITAYYSEAPDPSVPEQRVAFGTSGHRGSPFQRSFNEWHILAITQAICLYRTQQKIDGPLFLGMDPHALSEPALASALEVLAANGVEVMLAEKEEYAPTPVISHAILTYNRGLGTGLADGIVITPSHNPPHDGGFKYNPPNGGPAETGVTGWIEAKANEFLDAGLQGVKRIPYEKALHASTTHWHDYLNAYVSDLGNVIDMDAIRDAKISLGVDPAWRCRGSLLGAYCRALRIEPHRRQRVRRSDLPFHDA